MTAFEIIERHACAPAGCPTPAAFEEGRLARLLAGLRDRAFPRRLRPSRQEVPLPRRLGRVRRRARAAAGLSRPCRSHRRRRPRAAVPPGPGAVALVSQHQLQQPAVGHRPRRAADRAACIPRRSPRSALADGDAHPHRQRQGQRRRPRPRLRRACSARVVIVEGLWPNHAFEEGIGINLLTSADPGLPGGGAVFHDTAVWLRPA